jgi:group II intron reverse transcriptase/maturase
VDGITIEELEKDLKGNLYKIWNRMSSGAYFPPPVQRVNIPKAGGGERPLGIPTVGDRVAQMVVKMYLEPEVEKVFHPDSYGYRPNKSATEAVGQARQRCFKKAWVLDIDIKGFFDNIDHDLMMKAVRLHTESRWILLYISRWLKAPVLMPDGTREERAKGTPQGGVISPLLANIYLHHAFDAWMAREHPHIEFERYADDIVAHCKTEREAVELKAAVEERLRKCKLELHPEKTKIVYCKNQNRGGGSPHESFDFLGYTFRPREAKNRWGVDFVSFLPGISGKAEKRICETVGSWRIGRRTERSLEEIASEYNSIIRGWINYYGQYYKTAMRPVLQHLNRRLVRWAQRKYRRYRHQRRATYWLRGIARRQPGLFAHWAFGVRP